MQATDWRYETKSLEQNPYMITRSKYKMFGFKLFKRVEVLLHDQVVFVRYTKTHAAAVLIGLVAPWYVQ